MKLLAQSVNSNLVWAVLQSIDMMVIAFVEAIVFLSVHDSDFLWRGSFHVKHAHWKFCTVFFSVTEDGACLLLINPSQSNSLTQ